MEAFQKGWPIYLQVVVAWPTLAAMRSVVREVLNPLKHIQSLNLISCGPSAVVSQVNDETMKPGAWQPTQSP